MGNSGAILENLSLIKVAIKLLLNLKSLYQIYILLFLAASIFISLTLPLLV